jgi:hypothetical protein
MKAFKNVMGDQKTSYWLLSIHFWKLGKSNPKKKSMAV